MATKVCTIDQFYGIVQHRDGSLLGIGTAADARNMDASDGNLSVAKGYEKRVDIPIPGTDKLVKLIVIMGEADRYVAVGREHVYFYNGTAWSSVYTFETPLAKDAVAYVQAKINIDDYIIICTGESPMLKVKAADGETAVFGSADNGSEAQCNYICKYYGRVFAAGDPLNPNRLYWSCVPGDGRTIEYWLMVEGSADASGGHTEIGDSNGDPIMGICSIGNQVVIFKRYSTWRLYGDRPSNYTVEQVDSASHGMANSSAIIVTDVPYWLTKNGIYYFNNTSIQPIDREKYLTKFLDEVNSVMQSKGACVKNKMYFTCRTADSGADDAIIVFDLIRGTYMIRDGLEVHDMVAFDDELFFVNDTRYVYQFERGGSYDGAPIRAYWKTQATDLGETYAEKQFKRVYMRCRGERIVVSFRTDQKTDTTTKLIRDDEIMAIPLFGNKCGVFDVTLANENGSRFTVCGGVDIVYERSQLA